MRRLLLLVLVAMGGLTPLAAADASILLQRTQWSFDEAWVVWRKPTWAALTIGSTAGSIGGATLVLAADAAGQETIIFTAERDSHALGRAEALTLDVVADDDGATVVPRLLDAEGHMVIGERRRLNAGTQTLRWAIPGDLHDPKVMPAMPLRFHDLLWSRSAGNAPLTITLTTCKVEESVTAAQAVAVAIETDHPLPMWQAEPSLKAEKAPRLKLHNRTAKALSLHLELEASGYRGSHGTWAGDVDVAANADVYPALPGTMMETDLQQPGIRWLRWKINERGGQAPAVEGLGSWAVVAPLGQANVPGGPGFQYSVCTHTERWSDADQAREALTAGILGVTSARTGVSWGGLQPAAGEWTWKRMDQIVDLYAAQHIEIQTLLGFGNAWADKPGRTYPAAKSWFNPPQSEPWRAYVRGMAEHYRGRIRFWEVWNEPDLDGFFPGSTADYLELLRSAHDELHKVDPRAQVMTGGFGTLLDHGARATNPRLMEEVLHEAPEAFDILAFHQHGSFAEIFQPVVDGPLARLRAQLTPAKPLWFNETAVSYTWDSLSELLAKQTWQADEVVRKLVFSRARGAMGYTWYDLRNDGDDRHDGEHNFGLVTFDFQPKAAFCAYANLIRTLCGKEFVRAMDLGQGRHGYLFSSAANEHVVVLFNQDERMADMEVAATWDAGATAEVIDAMGAALGTKGSTQGGQSLAITARPRLLIVHGGSAPRVAPLIAVADPGPALPSRPLTAVVDFTNPFAHPTVLRLTWRLPAALGAGSVSSETPVPAHGQVQVSPVIKLPITLTSDSSTACNGRMEWALPEGGWQGVVMVPLKIAIVIPSGPAAERPADFVLADQRQVFNRFMNDPAHTALLWKGPADLSAQVWLGHEAEQLTMHMVVRDSVHHQPYRGMDTWRADGIQIGMVVPGQVGWWELGLARGDDGMAQTWCWRRPVGFADPGAALHLETAIIPGGVDYRVRIPDAALGLERSRLSERGLTFNVVINDDDGDGGRKGYIQFVPGIADTKDPTLFPLVVFTP